MTPNKKSIYEAFEKKYKLRIDYPNINFRGETLFSAEPWEDPAFMEIKTLLNEQKNRLNDYDLLEWQNHTNNVNPAKCIAREIKANIQPELFTVAWSKFYECVCSFDLIPKVVKQTKKMNTLHLCEAPGAFITSFNHYLKLHHSDIEWKWKASTLNPYYEGNSLSMMINDDRFIKHTLNNWTFGSDYSGNIMDWQNSQSIIEEMKGIGEVNLITSDGSIDCSLNPEEQESIVSSLHFCEVLTALQVLSTGGTFILKLFTILEHFTINLIFLLLNHFEEINFFKPCTSKSGNSEIYVICLNFKGLNVFLPFLRKFQLFYGTELFSTKSMFPYDVLPKPFIEDLLQASIFYFKYQCNQIDDNIKYYELKSKNIKKIRRLQIEIKEAFFTKYNMKTIDDDEKICKNSCYSQKTITIFNNSLFHSGSYYERINIANNLWNERIDQIKEEIKLFDANIYDGTQIGCEKLQKGSLKFTYGKPIEYLQSSKFVNPHIFKLYNELNEFISKTIIYSNLHKISYSIDFCTITFSQYLNNNLYDGWEKSFVKVIINAINVMKAGDTLVMKNFDITLTQFGLGIFYLIATTGFEKLIFKKDYSICLEKMTNKNNLLTVVEKLFEEINNSKNSTLNGRIISLLGVIDLNLLLAEDFYFLINKFNTSKLFEFIKSKLDK